MKALYKAIWDHFAMTTTSPLYSNLEGRLYHERAPQEVEFPYCIHFMVSDFNDLDFTDDREEIIVQFDIFSESFSAEEAADRLEDLKSMFDNAAMTATGWRHLRFQRDFVVPNNNLTMDPPIRGFTVQYNVLLERERS